MLVFYSDYRQSAAMRVPPVITLNRLSSNSFGIASIATVVTNRKSLISDKVNGD